MLEKLSRVTRVVLGKIIIKLLSIPGVKGWFERVTQLYEIVRLEKELDMLNGKRGACLLNFRHYLPDTEGRIDRLRRVINKRPVAIILHGPSVTELEERITELEDCDICYFSLNAFRVPEQHILQRINRNLSLVMYSAIRREPDSSMDDVIDFLDREEDNIFVSDRASFRALEPGFDLGKFIRKYDKKLLFFTGTPISSITIKDRLFLRAPSIEYPLHFPSQSSFSILLSLALIGEAPMVVIFGGDGGRINGRELHFRECGSSDPESVREQVLMVDTRTFNATMPLLLEKIYKMYNLKPVDIVNCSVQSHYTPLRKLSYDETFALLKSFKKGDQLKNGKPKYTVYHC